MPHHIPENSRHFPWEAMARPGGEDRPEFHSASRERLIFLARSHASRERRQLSTNLCFVLNAMERLRLGCGAPPSVRICNEICSSSADFNPHREGAELGGHRRGNSFETRL